MDFLQWNVSPLFLFAHNSDVKRTSDRRHEHKDECNTNKCVCLLDNIRKNPSTMADDTAIMFVNCFRENYLLAVYKCIMVIPACPHKKNHTNCVQGKHLM